jgi:hypothetical protein
MRAFYSILAVCLLPSAFHAQRAEVGAYVMLQGPVEVTRETYVFDGTTLSDTVDFPARGIRMEGVARYDDEYSPVSYALELFSASGEVPVQEVNVSFADTAAVWSTHTELGDSAGVSPIEGPYAFMQNLVFAHLAVVLLKYDHASGGTQSLDVWMPEQAAVLNMEITFTSSTSGTVEIAGTVMNVEVDDTGWLRRAAVPGQNVTVESRDVDSIGTW